VWTSVKACRRRFLHQGCGGEILRPGLCEDGEGSVCGEGTPRRHESRGRLHGYLTAGGRDAAQLISAVGGGCGDAVPGMPPPMGAMPPGMRPPMGVMPQVSAPTFGGPGMPPTNLAIANNPLKANLPASGAPTGTRWL
jgi:hypothetical protein